MAALKGKGKGRGNGYKCVKGYKGGNGKGYGGGKGGKGKGTYIGKGLNCYGGEDYYNPWGGDDYSDDYEYWNWGGDNYYMGVGNLTLMIERGGASGKTDPRLTQTNSEGTFQTHSDEYETANVTCKRRETPIDVTTSHNQYQALQSDDSDDDDDHNDHEDTSDSTTTDRVEKHKDMNKRQRRRRRERALQATFQCQCSPQGCDDNADELGEIDDEAVRDAAAANQITEDEWSGIQSNHYRNTGGWHPGSNHSGSLQCTSGKHGHNHEQYNNNNNNNNLGGNCPTLGSSVQLSTPDCNCFQSSEVACRSNSSIHPRSSQCGCSCKSSSGLSVVIARASERVTPHEWRVYGEEIREVMSPSEEFPTPKLLQHDGQWTAPPLVSGVQRVPRGARCTLRTCYLAPPRIGTRPSGYIPGVAG